MISEVDEFLRSFCSSYNYDADIRVSENDLMKLNLADKGGNTPLMNATASGENKMVHLLVRCGVSVNYINPKTRQKAIDIAWDNAQYESMMLLLKADSTFPQEFTSDAFYLDAEIPEELKLFVRSREDLHQWIKNNNLQKIEDLISKEKLSKYLSTNNESALETAAKYGSVSAMFILIGAQETTKVDRTNFTKDQLALLKCVTSNGNSLLNLAAESGKLDNVCFLIATGADINHCNEAGKRPIDLAWENKHYTIVLRLLEADSEIPTDFDPTCLCVNNDSQRNLKYFLSARDEFHLWIKKGRIEPIKIYIANSTPSTLYLNSEGKSAALTAIENKNLDIYAFILSQGCNFKDEIERSSLEISLSAVEKDILKKEMIKYFSSVDKSFVFYLLSKSKPHRRVNNFEEKVQAFYEKLSRIPEVLTMLEIVQYADYLDIIFDFDNENIKSLNPTASSSTKGTTDYKEGRLYIAGKMDDSKILGTLAHELTHLAMQMVYYNNCNPYKSENKDLEYKFKSIVSSIGNDNNVKKNILKLDSCDQTVDIPLVVLARAYRYPEKEKASELIVRIPHILAQFGNEGEIWFTQNVDMLQELLQYYKQRVIIDCKKFIQDSFLIKPRNIVRALNESIGVINTILETSISFKNCIDLTNFLSGALKENMLLLKCNCTWLTVLNFYQALKSIPNYTSHDSFLMLKYSSYTKHSEDVNKAFFLASCSLLILEFDVDSIFDSLSEHIKEWADLMKGNTEKRIIVIVNEDNTFKFEHILKGGLLANHYSVCKYGDFSLNDFSYESQEKILGKPVIFQNKYVKLNQLIDESEECRMLLEGYAIVRLLNEKEVTIGRDLPVSNGYDETYYINRKFNSKIILSTKILQEKSSDYIAHNEDMFIQHCRDNPSYNVHWLSFVSGKLIWQNSQGSIKNLIKYRDEISSYKENNLSYIITEEHLTKRGSHKKLVIISDTAGMGKSTVLTSLSLAIQNEIQGIWIIRIDLNHHTTAFEKEIKIRKSRCTSYKANEAINFLLDKILLYEEENQEIKFEKRLLQYHLQTKNSVVIFFDGFDEISPDYKDIVLELIQSLIPHVRQFWITTRPYMRLELETALETFAYTLRPLLFDEQIDFLTKFWQKSNPEFTNKGRVENYAKALIDILTQSISDKEKEFTGIPLQLRMVAEVFLKKQEISELLEDILEDMEEKIKPIKEGIQEYYFSLNEEPLLFEKMSLVSLYKLFIYKKYCDIYEAEKKLSIISNLPTKKDIKKSYPVYIEDHRLLSLYSVFTHEQCEILLSKKEKRNVKSLLQDISCGEEKRGIIDEVFNDRPHFIHQTFAEYFAADFLSNMLLGNVADEQMQDFFFKNVLLTTTYKVVRAFLNGLLEDRNPPKKTIEEYGSRLNLLWVSDLNCLCNINDTILHVSAKEGNANVVCFLLNCLRPYSDSLHSFVNFEDDKGRIAFFLAVSYNNVDTTKQLFIEGFNINTKNKHGETVLHLAVRDGYQDIVEWLVKSKETGGAGADVNAVDKDKFTVLHVAVDKDNLDIVKLLIDHGSSVNAVNSDNYSVLHNAIHSKIALQVVGVLVENGADVNVVDEEGNSLLHYAGYNGKLDVAKYLVDHGANINSKAIDNSTVLHEAAISGNKEFCEWLINECNLDVNAPDNNGCTPLLEAAQKDNLEIMKLLIEHKGNVFVKDVCGNNVLMQASKYGSPQLLEWLVDSYNFLLSSKNNYGRNMLHEATKHGNLELVEWLLERGLDPNSKDYSGNIVSTEVVKYEFLYSGPFSDRVVIFREKVWKKEHLLKNAYLRTGEGYFPQDVDIGILQCLIKYGGDINGHDANGKTVLHYAAERQQSDTVRWLLTPKSKGGAGADFRLTDINKETPLDLAVRVGDEDMIILIKEFAHQST